MPTPPETFLESFEEFVHARYQLAILDDSLVARKVGTTDKWLNARLTVVRLLRTFLSAAGSPGIDSFNGALIETAHQWLRAGAAPIERQVAAPAALAKR